MLERREMNLEPELWERISLWLAKLYRAREMEEQREVMCRLIMEFVPANSVALNRLEIETGHYTIRGVPDEIFRDEWVAETARYLHQSPYPAYHLATGDGRWKMTTDFMPLEDFCETDLYRTMRCWDIGVQMCAMLALVDGVAYALTVQRPGGGFSEREREILNALYPHLVTSFTNAMCFEKAGKSLERLKELVDHAPGAYGYFGHDGRLGWLQPRARGWLDGFFGAGGQDGLPGPVHGLLRRVLAGEHGTVHWEGQSAEEVLLTCLSPSPMGGWILRLEKRPLEVPFHFHALPEFSPRENEVLEWMVQGKRNAEIAAILEIAVGTVEKHVGAVLVKLGVENRAAAIVRAIERCGRL